MVRAPALDQRDGAGDDAALAGAHAARQIREVESSRRAAQRHKFALEPHAPVSVPPPQQLPAGRVFSIHFKAIERRHGRYSGWLTFSELSFPQRGTGRYYTCGWGPGGTYAS